MAVTVSGLYIVTWEDILDATQLAIDLSLTTHKIALLSNSATGHPAGSPCRPRRPAPPPPRRR
jgi:hypothetical protein